MKAPVTERLEKILQDNVIKARDISIIKGYLEASKKYEILVSSGLATKRGNNLIPRDRVYKNNAKFNV